MGDSVAIMNPSELERNHVVQVYEHIASHFSDTRHSCWPKVTEYLKSLEKGSLILDIGCGNGKYQEANPEILLVGCDISCQLLKICLTKNMNVFQAEAMKLPVRDEFVDHCISIAVIHHLASSERRLKALREIVRILRPGGTALIYVWALEQELKDGKSSKYLKKQEKVDEALEVKTHLGIPIHTNRRKFGSQDVFVPWKSKSSSETFLRFYHVFKENELEELCSQLNGVAIIKRYYDEGNWCLVIAKNK